MPVDLPTFALIHVVLSLLGIVSGLVVVGGLMAGVRFGGWIGFFLATTALTNLSGFGFPFVTLLPSHIVAALSLLILLGVAAALYWKRLAGAWRTAFVVLGVLALYLNVFVLLVQLFHKLRVLAVAAPSPSAPGSVITQLLVAVLFVALGRAAVRGFRDTGADPGQGRRLDRR